MNPVRVTVGLPFYNNERTLMDAIRSVFAQTYTDWELVLLDDGSTDASLALAKQVRHPRVVVHSDGVNRGLVWRLNQLATLARGAYLARLDSDDMMHPERLARQVAFLDQHPEIAFVDTALYSLDSQDRPAGVRATGARRPFTLAELLRYNDVVHPSILGQTSWFRAHPYDPAYVRAEDFELWCRTCKDSAMGSLPEPLYFYREGRVNLRNYLLSCRMFRRIIREYAPRCLSGWETQRLLLLSHLKGWIYRICHGLRCSEYLVSRRNDPLSPADAQQAAAVIERIRATPVPGVD